ncbi:N-acetyltransferase [Rhodococcus rhodnii]|uniref:Acetyltransferase n=2 Tax=Rhodococcus rhodnii TaxID=38312 RepID=R7WNP2_9NOCA|nr:GNAT family protein [Rhodococcus rhodnii]EOM76923.1 acetyltransferase [Rhodococcus rhodnii LMG 5362]TXG89809.1 N-acetyltransferase [Rhodococcus rhodnii]
MTDWFGRPVLRGAAVRLEPLSSSHVDALLAAADDASLFTWSSSQLTTRDDAAALVDESLRDPLRVPFVVIDGASGTVVGTTSLYAIDPRHRSLAIGYTWLSRSVQGTAINPDSKQLLLTHAFDVLGCVRVEWHVDERNTHSRRAVEKLGARLDGLLPKHRRRRDGSWRTTALYSMTDDDWPTVRRALAARVENTLSRS